MKLYDIHVATSGITVVHDLRPRHIPITQQPTLQPLTNPARIQRPKQSRRPVVPKDAQRATIIPHFSQASEISFACFTNLKLNNPTHYQDLLLHSHIKALSLWHLHLQSTPPRPLPPVLRSLQTGTKTSEQQPMSPG